MQLLCRGKGRGTFAMKGVWGCMKEEEGEKEKSSGLLKPVGSIQQANVEPEPMKHRLPQRCGGQVRHRTGVATLHLGLSFTNKAYKLNVTSSNTHLPKPLKPQLWHHRLVTSCTVVEVAMAAANRCLFDPSTLWKILLCQLLGSFPCWVLTKLL